MSKLPTGWATTTLGTIVEFKYGKALPATTRDGGDFPVFGSNGVVGYHSEWFSAAPTIVIGRKGSVGEVCFTYKNCSPIDTTYYIDSFDSINPKLCFYLLKTLRLGDLNKSTAIPGLNRQDAYNLEIQLPPFEEQMRIAQKLDELLAQVYTLKARIDAIPALLKRFRQSVLAASVSGRVTEEWRMAHASVSNEESIRYQSIEVLEPWSHTIEAPIGWTSNIFEDVIKLVGGSQPPKSEFIYEEAPELVRLIQIRDYKSDNHKVFIRRESTKKFCSADDIMIGRYGPPIFQILKGLEGAYNVALMKAVPLSGTLKNNYMYRYLQNYKILNFVEAGSDRTAGQSGVNKAFLEKYPIFVPPLTEQTEIVRRVEQLFAFADNLEAKVAAAKSRIDNLTQSLLAKAFRGELVPQDPNDESASVLLERIKTQRAATLKAKRSRKTSA